MTYQAAVKAATSYNQFMYLPEMRGEAKVFPRPGKPPRIIPWEAKRNTGVRTEFVPTDDERAREDWALMP